MLPLQPSYIIPTKPVSSLYRLQMFDTSSTSLDYTSPVFFWTNIEISLGVVSACLPTLRPLWTHYSKSKSSTTSAIPMKAYFKRRYRQFEDISLSTSNEHVEATLTNDSGVGTCIEADRIDPSIESMGNAISVEQVFPKSQPIGV